MEEGKEVVLSLLSFFKRSLPKEWSPSPFLMICGLGSFSPVTQKQHFHFSVFPILVQILLCTVPTPQHWDMDILA